MPHFVTHHKKRVFSSNPESIQEFMAKKLCKDVYRPIPNLERKPYRSVRIYHATNA
ncbi:MAG: hypothetical protein GVX78_02820 [Bacteroidetes bacterium]|nr:hypothetical protein [Bacteroidota bacterium]